MNDQQPASKKQLITRLMTSAQALEELLDQISPGQLSITPAVEGWTVKDILVHINFWLEFLNVQITAARLHNDVPQVHDINETNRQVITRSQSQTWDQVHARFPICLEELITTIQDLSDEDLFTPGRFPQIDPEPLWLPIAWEGYEHIDDHAGQLGIWWQVAGRA